MENNNCPICGQNNTEIIFKRGNLNKDLINVICKNCSLVYINPRPSKAEYHEFHKEEFLGEKKIKEIEDIKQKMKSDDRKLKQTIFDFIKEYVKPGMKILDVGCGFGTFLDIIKNEVDVEVYGVELGRLDVEAAKKYYNLDLFNGSLEEFANNPENIHKFDIIVTHHTFEHLPKPSESLEQMKSLLKQDGCLYIGIPNLMNIKKRPDILFQIAHPFTYSPYSLGLILEHVGFGITKYNRNAGYPGGFEVMAKMGEKNITGLDEGSHYQKVIDYVNKTDNGFKKMRGVRDKLLFFLPKSLRLRFGRIFSQFLKHQDRYFKYILLFCAFLSGLIFILRHLIIFRYVTLSGGIYNFFSFANPDGLTNLAPMIRGVFDGTIWPSDGRIFETQGLPALWSFLSPIFVTPIFWLTQSLDWTFIIGHFLEAFLFFILFYIFAYYLTGKKYFSLFFTFSVSLAPLLSNYLFPISIDNLKLVARSFLPFGSPPGEVLLSKYISFSILPSLTFFIIAPILIYFTLKKKEHRWLILSSFNIALLIYLYITHAIYILGAVMMIGLISLIKKDIKSFNKMLLTGILSLLFSIPYWINFFAIKALPFADELYKRVGGEITHQFRWSMWPMYIIYILMVLFILSWGKRNNKKNEVLVVAGMILSTIFVLNMQVITGFNPAPAVWAYHQSFLGFAFGWLIIIFAIYNRLSRKINPLKIKVAFLLLFLLLFCKIIYTEVYAANILKAHHNIPQNIYNSLVWLNENTTKDDVILTPSLVTNALIPAYTHNNSFMPVAVTGPVSISEIKERLFIVYKIFNVSPEYFKEALNRKLPYLDDYARDQENALQTWLFDAFYFNTGLDETMYGGRYKSAPVQDIEKIIKDYTDYLNNNLLNSYRANYIYYGPYEQLISEPNFSNYKEIYDSGNIRIYKLK